MCVCVCVVSCHFIHFVFWWLSFTGLIGFLTAQSICQEKKSSFALRHRTQVPFVVLCFQGAWEDDFPFPKVGFLLVS